MDPTDEIQPGMLVRLVAVDMVVRDVGFDGSVTVADCAGTLQTYEREEALRILGPAVSWHELDTLRGISAQASRAREMGLIERQAAALEGIAAFCVRLLSGRGVEDGAEFRAAIEKMIEKAGR